MPLWSLIAPSEIKKTFARAISAPMNPCLQKTAITKLFNGIDVFVTNVFLNDFAKKVTSGWPLL